MTSSSGTKTMLSPTCRKRGTPEPTGTLTRTSAGWSLPGVRTVTSRLSDRFEMNGNGCAGSIANGVISGKMFCR